MPSLIERRKEIVNRAESEGRVDVKELARMFEVSEVTIRNDLNALSARGLVVRSRGGAVASTRLTRELSIKEKYNENLAIKCRLGEAAIQCIGKDVRSILVDSGTTTEEVARGLTGFTGLTVMTNGLNVATALADADGLEIKVTGGTLRPKSMSFYGRHAEESLRLMHFDLLFLGVDGFDLSVGIATHFEQEASLNRVMCEVASKIVVVADSSKFGRHGSHVICRHTDIDILVTDSGAPPELLQVLRDAGIEVRVIDL